MKAKRRKVEVIIQSNTPGEKRWHRSFGMNTYATVGQAVKFIEDAGFTFPSPHHWSLRPEYGWRVRQGKAVRARWTDGKRVRA